MELLLVKKYKKKYPVKTGSFKQNENQEYLKSSVLNAWEVVRRNRNIRKSSPRKLRIACITVFKAIGQYTPIGPK